MSDDTRISDDELMLLVRDNDDVEAFEELHRRHSGRTRCILIRGTNNSPDADDLNQEVWVKVWFRKHQFQKGQSQADCKFIAWLMTITRNTLIDWVRRKERGGVLIQIDEPLLDWLTQQADQTSQAQETFEKLRHAFAHLSPDEQKIIILKYIYGFTLKEIAMVIGYSPPTVKGKLVKAQARLRSYLEEEGIVLKA